MSFIERANALAAARDALGVDIRATEEEIRAAWKRVAFETHPDRNGGSRQGFDRANAAYALLRGAVSTSDEPQNSPASGDLQRPTVAPRIDRLSREAVDACEKALKEQDRLPGAAPRSSAVDLDIGEGGGMAFARATTDHVPTTVERVGRNMTFVVAGDLSEGLNRVAIPSAEFRDRRKVAPRVVVFRSPRSGPGQVSIPDHLLQGVVPGARSVKIQFIGTEGDNKSRTAA